MKRQFLSLLLLFSSSALFFAACSEKSFNSAPGSVFQQCVKDRPEVKCELSCKDANTCVRKFDYSIDAQGQVTDILFVVDNSGSMYQDQLEMASKFPSFLNSISNINYRIGITTTDISSPSNTADANNGNGALQDGKLISFQNGAAFLTGSLGAATEQTYFQNTITRQETLKCENSNYDRNSCPSGDERGIFAAALTIQNNYSDFIRPAGHMAVVFLSDEDEGSDGQLVDAREVPANFINNFKAKFPSKSLKAHSIIIQPNTAIGQSCYNEQAREAIQGQYGRVYAQLTSSTSGVLGNICAANYTNQLQEIGQSVSQTREVLPCTPIDNSLKVSYNPVPPYSVTFTVDAFQNEVLFSKALPKGTKIQFQFNCAE
jgi:hypothetical protein